MKITRIEDGKKVVYLQLKDIVWMYDNGYFFQREKVELPRENGKGSRVFEYEHEPLIGIYCKIFKAPGERLPKSEMERYFRFEDAEEVDFINNVKVKFFEEKIDRYGESRHSDGEYRSSSSKSYAPCFVPAIIDWTDVEALGINEFASKYAFLEEQYRKASAQMYCQLFYGGADRKKIAITDKALCNVYEDISKISAYKKGEATLHFPEDDKPLPIEPESEEDVPMSYFYDDKEF